MASILIFVFAVGLASYRPTKKANLVRQAVRRLIVRFLRTQPGSSITSICRNTQIAWGTAQHHLYLLSRAGIVNSLPAGRARAFFATGAGDENHERLALLQVDPAKRIGLAIVDKPGSLQRELLETLGMTRKVFRRQMNLLVAAGLVTELKGPKVRRYHPAEGLANLLARTPPVPSVADRVSATDDDPVGTPPWA